MKFLEKIGKTFTPKGLENPLAGLFCMDDSVTIYVPSTSDVNNVIDSSEYVNAFLSLLAEMFGGSSAESVQGAWVSDTKGLVKEGITKVYAFASAADLQKNTEKILFAVREMKSDLKQEAVGIELSGKFYLV